MIPRRIHYCWFGRKEKPELVKQCLASWQRYLPDYEVREWNEDTFDLTATDYLRRCHQRQQWAFLSDYARLWALENQGGIYLDTDIEVIKPLDSFLHDEAFLGLESAGSRVLANAAVIGAVPGHKAVCAFRQSYLTNQVYDEKGYVKPIPSGVITPLLEAWGLRGCARQQVNGVMVYERQVFYPFYYNEPFTPECIAPQTHTIHWWHGSWRGQRQAVKPKGFGRIREWWRGVRRHLARTLGLAHER